MPERTIYFDVTDLLLFFSQNSKPTGIQRTVVNLIDALRADDEANAQVRFLFVEHDALTIREAAASLIYKLAHDVKVPLAQDLISATVNECYTSGQTPQFRPDDLCLIAGVFWISPDSDRVLTQMREQGVLIGLYAYDLIHLNQPQLVDPQASARFRRRLTQILFMSDFQIAISQHTERELSAFILDAFGASRPVGVVPPAQENDIGRAAAESPSEAVVQASAAPFALCVGTIDRRKNQRYLLEIWRTLLSEGSVDPPRLVLAGHWGFQGQDVRDYLAETDYLGGKVSVVEGPSDAELAFLYQACSFTVFPSKAEGWGLPVSESLAYGKPCIASNAGAVPEVGGDLVRYLDPDDLASGLRDIRKVVEDEAGLRAWAERIAHRFTPTTWREAARALIAQSFELAPRSAAERAPLAPELPAGQVISLGSDPVDGASGVLTLIAPFARVDGWYPVEHWGSWSSSRSPTLRFRCEAGADGRIVVALAVRGALPSENNRVAVRNHDHAATTSKLRQRTRWVFVDAMPDDGGMVELALSCDGDFPKPEADHRSFYVGLTAIGYFRQGDLAQQVQLLQSALASSVD